MKPKIIVTRDIPDEVELRLKDYFQVSFNREDKVFGNDILKKAMENVGSHEEQPFEKRCGFERRLGPNLDQTRHPRGSKMASKPAVLVSQLS